MIKTIIGVAIDPLAKVNAFDAFLERSLPTKCVAYQEDILKLYNTFAIPAGYEHLVPTEEKLGDFQPVQKAIQEVFGNDVFAQVILQRHANEGVLVVYGLQTPDDVITLRKVAHAAGTMFTFWLVEDNENSHVPSVEELVNDPKSFPFYYKVKEKARRVFYPDQIFVVQDNKPQSVWQLIISAYSQAATQSAEKPVQPGALGDEAPYEPFSGYASGPSVVKRLS